MPNVESFLKGGEQWLASIKEASFAFPGDILALLSVYRPWVVKLSEVLIERKRFEF